MAFHEIVYRLIVHERRITARELAEALGLAETTIYARCRGRGYFRPEEIRKILRVVPDIRLAAWFLTGSNYVPVERAIWDPESSEAFESLRRTALMMLIEAAAAAEEIECALEDGRVDHREAVEIRKDIESAERAIVTLREHLTVFAK